MLQVLLLNHPFVSVFDHFNGVGPQFLLVKVVNPLLLGDVSEYVVDLGVCHIERSIKVSCEQHGCLSLTSLILRHY
jgi:hypothetical protein